MTNMSEIGNNGIDGARRPERERPERVERRRSSESGRSERREAPRENDRVELSSSREDVDRLERRAKELAAQVAREDDSRQEKLRHVRENLEEIVSSRKSHERAAEALYADVLRDRN